MLKRKMNQKNKIVGIYKIISPSGKVYIGQSRDIKSRWRAHRTYEGKSKLINSMRKYGCHKHRFVIIHRLPSDVIQEVLDTYEQLYMDAYRDCGIELLNLREAGSWGTHSEETRKLIGEKSKGHKMPEHLKVILSKINKGHTRNRGRVLTEEHRMKISEGNKGKVISDEHRRKNSESKKGEKCYWFGIEPSKHPQAKKIINTITGDRFGSITEAARAIGMKRNALSMILTGKNINKTGFVYDLEPSR